MARAGSLWARAESWLTWTFATESEDGRLGPAARAVVKAVMLRTVMTSAERKRYLRAGEKREMMGRLRI